MVPYASTGLVLKCVEIIESENQLKLLGFIFSKKPDAGEHVKYIIQKANSAILLIRNLAKAGWDKISVLKVYKTNVRSIVEYMSAIYHPMLSVAQERKLEDIQKRAL